MDNDRCDRWSRALAAPARLAPTEPPTSARFDTLARALGVATSRRGVVGALLAALLAPRLPAAGATAGQRGSCPCPDPPCFLAVRGQDPSAPGQLDFPADVAVAPDGTVYVTETRNQRLQAFCVAP